MDCIILEEDLSAYLDGELATQENKELEEHILKCPKCQKIVKEFEDLSNFLDNYEIPKDGSSEVDTFYSRTMITYQRKTYYRVCFAYINVILIGIVIGFFIFFTKEVIHEKRIKKEIMQEIEILNHTDFDLLKDLYLLENIEVFRYFTPEMLNKWKKIR